METTYTTAESTPQDALAALEKFSSMAAPSIADYALDGGKAFILARMKHARAPYAAQVYARYEMDLEAQRVRLYSVNHGGKCVTYTGGWIDFDTDTARLFIKAVWRGSMAQRRAPLRAFARRASQLAHA